VTTANGTPLPFDPCCVGPCLPKCFAERWLRGNSNEPLDGWPSGCLQLGTQGGPDCETATTIAPEEPTGSWRLEPGQEHWYILPDMPPADFAVIIESCHQDGICGMRAWRGECGSLISMASQTWPGPGPTGDIMFFSSFATRDIRIQVVTNAAAPARMDYKMEVLINPH